MSADYRTVLCPTDLSAAGDEAVALAYRIVADGGIFKIEKKTNLIKCR